MDCPLCRQRAARRRCPALDRDICAVCCGTKRLAEIRLPGRLRPPEDVAGPSPGGGPPPAGARPGLPDGHARGAVGPPSPSCSGPS
ncbi:MAG: hypothetical protein M0C28_13315 [Candidatus Moduliflexus flocculans]|nr:hypothetical protein [Candidatus Moduliflexus flocculans]